MAEYRLSKFADKDIGNIAYYTIERFGIRQASLYRDGLFKALAVHPPQSLLSNIWLLCLQKNLQPR